MANHKTGVSGEAVDISSYSWVHQAIIIYSLRCFRDMAVCSYNTAHARVNIQNSGTPTEKVFNKDKPTSFLS